MEDILKGLHGKKLTKNKLFDFLSEIDLNALHTKKEIPKVEYEEFIRLLLIQINTGSHLNFFEKIKFRTHVMKLWIMHITNFRDKGYNNIIYHLGVVLKYDIFALIFFIPAIIFRTVELIIKLVYKAF